MTHATFRFWRIATAMTLVAAGGACSSGSNPQGTSSGGAGADGAGGAGGNHTSAGGGGAGGAAAAGGAAKGGASGGAGSNSSGGSSSSTGSGGSSSSTGSGGSSGPTSSGGGNGDAALTDAAGTSGGSDSVAFVKAMAPGWNLGNTLDATPNETGWGNPVTTQAMIDAVKAAGFHTVRVPVTWAPHLGPAPTYTIDTAWFDRVEEVLNYVLKDGMYAIVNTHGDENAWVTLSAATQASVAEELATVWTQIATRLADYDDHLIFEDLNEPKSADDTKWSGGTAESRAALNVLHAAAVKAIRATGGKNATRKIMLPTHAAQASATVVNALEVPDDPNILISIHVYDPNGLAFGGQAAWGTDADKTTLTAHLDSIAELLTKKGRAVVMGEWGSNDQNNTPARVAHAQFYAQGMAARRVCPVWWDNGGDFGILDRKANPPSFNHADIAAAVVDGTKAGFASPAF